MEGLLDWLSGLPVAALYATLAVAAALENIVPPVPADTVVAFGSFLAARGKGSAIGSFLSTWTGNLAGASIMYWAGRRYGLGLLRRFGFSERSEARMKAMHSKYGYGAIFLSRFLPGVRAIVPPFAGAAHVPFVPALVLMGIASGIWYAAITWLAFQVGASWEDFSDKLGDVGRIVAIGAGALIVIGVLVWWWRGRRPS